MMHKVSEQIAQEMVKRGFANEERTEETSYGIELILGSIVNTIILIAVSIVLNRVTEMLCWSAVFLTVRAFSGGYHFNTHLGCIISLQVIFIAGMTAVYYTPLELFFPMLLALCMSGLMLLFFLAPVEDPDKPFGKDSGRIATRCRIVSVLTAALIVVPGIYYQQNVLLFSAAIGFITASLSVPAGIIKNYLRRKSV